MKKCPIPMNLSYLNSKAIYSYKLRQSKSGRGRACCNMEKPRSSALLVLLFFYNVEAKPITLSINGNPVTFNSSIFGFQNPVMRTPSCIDVVLTSTETKDVLFLESKFLEPFYNTCSRSSKIPHAYITNEYSAPIYKRLPEIGLIPNDYNSDSPFRLKTEDGSKLYLDGIKQVISHYVGLRTRLARVTASILPNDTKRPYSGVLTALRDPDSHIYLGEILYDCYPPCGAKEKALRFADYQTTYSQVANLLNSQLILDNLSDKFHVLATPFAYSKVAKDNESQIEDETLKFYSLI